MQYHETRIKLSHCYILTLGDVHIGDKNADIPLLKKNLKWVEDTPEARIMITGDLLNCATRNSASNPFDQDMSLDKQIEFGVELLRPVKDKIIGAINGNHEDRLYKFTGYSPMNTICLALQIPHLKNSAVVAVNIGMGKMGRGHYIYTGYYHHTTGGGRTPGSKVNRVDKLRDIVPNCDYYVGAHNHAIASMPVATREVDTIHKKIIEKRQQLILGGGYVKWEDGYSEQMMLAPLKLGSARIRLDGTKRDIHVST